MPNGAGGDRGKGSGMAFLGFHRAMMNRLSQFAATKKHGIAALPANVTGAIPLGLPDATPVLGSEAEPRISNTFADMGMAIWLTVDGNGTPTWGQYVKVDGTDYPRLTDFPNPDVLGRAMGESSYHIQGHNLIGGTMADQMRSPADPIFYGWHAHLDRILSVWLTTPKGIAWRNANPTHPLLQTGFTQFNGWDNTDFD